MGFIETMKNIVPGFSNVSAASDDDIYANDADLAPETMVIFPTDVQSLQYDEEVFAASPIVQPEGVDFLDIHEALRQG